MFGLLLALAPEVQAGTGLEWLVVVSVVLPMLFLFVVSYFSPED